MKALRCRAGFIDGEDENGSSMVQSIWMGANLVVRWSCIAFGGTLIWATSLSSGLWIWIWGMGIQIPFHLEIDEDRAKFWKGDKAYLTV